MAPPTTEISYYPSAPLLSENLRPNIYVVDRVAFRKKFAKEPGYWIEILYQHNATKLWKVRRYWKWFDKVKKTTIAGQVETPLTGSLNVVLNEFNDYVDIMGSKNYVAVERHCVSYSPANRVIETETPMLSIGFPDSIIARPEKRRGAVDWW